MIARLRRHPVEPGPLSVRDLDDLVRRLPPARRAAVAWAPQAIRGAVQRLLDDSLTRELIGEASREAIRAFHGCWPVLAEVFADLTVLRAELEGLWRDKLILLRGYLVESAVADEAEWAFRAVSAMFDLVQSIDPREFTAALESTESSELEGIATDEGAGLLRAQVLLVAVLEAADQGREPSRAMELAELAFDEAHAGVVALARIGVTIDPYRGETVAERGARLMRYADHARQSLTDEDVRTLAAARLRDMR